MSLLSDSYPLLVLTAQPILHSQVPRSNVATIHHGATVLEGVSRLRNSLIDGDVSVYNLNYGFTCHQLDNGSIDVQLSQPFLVSSMRYVDS